MTPKEKTVIRAIIMALKGDSVDNMDALATSYELRDNYFDAPRPMRAAILLQALVDAR